MNATPDPSRDPRDPRGLLGRVAGSVTGRMVDAVDDLVLDHVDVDALLERVDVNALLDRVDTTRLLDRVDVDRLLEQVDVDRLLDRVDVDRLAARIDVERLLAGVDLEAIVRRSGIPDIVAESTGRVAGSALDLARRQLVGLDVLVDSVVDRVVDLVLVRLLRRGGLERRNGPPALDIEGPVISDGVRMNVSGHYAGALSRAAALALDAVTIVTTYTIGYAGLDQLSKALLQRQLSGEYSSPIAATLLVVWGFLYVFGSLAVAGRTLGKAVVGLQVLARSGRPVTVPQALLRTLLLPLSAVLFGAGFLLAVVQRDNRSLHDLLAGTCVVYDWGERSALLPGPLSDFLTRTGARPGAGGGNARA